MSGIPPAVQEWLDKYPEPNNKTLRYVDKSEVAEAIRRGSTDFLIIDLRKDDFVGGKIKGAYNIPAQSIYNSVEDLYKLAEDSGKKTIYVHCRSSRDRATRTAGYFNDVADNNGNTITTKIIRGGILDWVSGGPEYTQLLDEYDSTKF
ncbi:hypothetical protein AWJ20_5003 [Sugiyamaella lignohabitans]|uniref:Rhodanese domain-containing protein n=1 Tax=Sugiyamaella lignohabitans TaxID=796027 RepID=A0A161HLA8_9ASCO|nr:uncharacterized protein AWJ20_5003 [Sugiyamaella lignohabitans]ANB14047.1 hypothetical protein AWJ20_5003 [Sugiyamaella lignohabitans]